MENVQEGPGEVAILNVGYGDTKLSFDKSNPAECARARRIVGDMLKRGYAILVAVGKDKKSGEPLYRRAHGFDAETDEYIVAGGPEDEIDLSAEKAPEAAPYGLRADGKPRQKPGRRPGYKRVAAGTARVTAVGRTAGG